MPNEVPGLAKSWCVRVFPASARLDGHGRNVLSELRQIGFEHIEAIASSRLYFLVGNLDETHVHGLARDLLSDRVAESYTVTSGLCRRVDSHPAIEVHRLPGVMDPAAMSTLGAARRLLRSDPNGQATIDQVQTGRRYQIIGAQTRADLERIAASVLANECVETWYLDGFDRSDPIPEKFPEPPQRPFSLRRVPIRNLSDQKLARLSREGHLFLSLAEMQTIRDHYVGAERDPTDLELEMLAQTWSEHCVHKTLKSAIDYEGDDFGSIGSARVHFDNLLGETIVKVTRELDRDWCLSVFVDNAGIVAFDEDYGIAFKVETHNHPSALEPYGGAATGIGGCIRDIMGCGLGAKPIASTDVFCVAPPDFDADRLPGSVLHPRRVLRGVVRGVRDYGNRMGIPTVNGAIHFDDRFVANPLVFCGCVGLIPRDRIAKQPHPGDRIVVAGGRTGRDGIHGATFSSAELTETHADEFSHAVQIGHAIEEKKVLDAMLLARDHAAGCLYSSVTDCGAGGLSSAVGEMAEHLGAEVDLDTVPLKYSGLSYDEIWISEAQERMVFSVPPDHLDTFLAVFAAEEVEATVIGTFADDRMLRVRFQGESVGELDMAFLHDGRPKTTLTARWTSADRKPIVPAPRRRVSQPASSNGKLLAALGELNTASKEWVIRQYDHEVQGRSVVKPLAGPGHGPSDAAVVRPRYDSDLGIAIGCGMSLELADVDPYLMAIAAVDEALRNVICVGADPLRIAILDNFCWPKVDSAESLGALVRTCVGARDAGIAYGLPFVSGKDSLNNEFTMSADEAKRTGLPARIAIPYTLLISALGRVNDVRKCVTMDLKEPGNVLVLASASVIPSLSALADLSRDRSDPSRDRKGADSEPAFAESFAMHQRVAGLIAEGKVRAAHDVSDGGLAVAIAEMCIASNLGASVNKPPASYQAGLFEETQTTYVLEMNESNAKASGLAVIGRVESQVRLHIEADAGDPIDVPVDELARAWRSPLAAGGGS